MNVNTSFEQGRKTTTYKYMEKDDIKQDAVVSTTSIYHGEACMKSTIYQRNIRGHDEGACDDDAYMNHAV